MDQVFLNPIIVAIDKNSETEAYELSKELQGHIGAVKLGLEYFDTYGPEGIIKIQNLDIPIFLDLKIGAFFSGTNTFSPVLGFLPFLDFLFLTDKEPKPLISTLPSFSKVEVIFSSTRDVMPSTSFCIRWGFLFNNFLTN